VIESSRLTHNPTLSFHVRLHRRFPHHFLPHILFEVLLRQVRGLHKWFDFKRLAYRGKILRVGEGLVNVFLEHTHCLQKLSFVCIFAMALKNVTFQTIHIFFERCRSCASHWGAASVISVPVASSTASTAVSSASAAAYSPCWRCRRFRPAALCGRVGGRCWCCICVRLTYLLWRGSSGHVLSSPTSSVPSLYCLRFL
jgi:hypothetical protein